MKLAVTGVGTKPLLLPPLKPPHSAAFTAWFGSGLARDVCEQIKHSPLAFVFSFDASQIRDKHSFAAFFCAEQIELVLECARPVRLETNVGLCCSSAAQISPKYAY